MAAYDLRLDISSTCPGVLAAVCPEREKLGSRLACVSVCVCVCVCVWTCRLGLRAVSESSGNEC